MTSKQAYVFCALKNCLGSPLAYWLLLLMKKCPELRALTVSDFKELSK